MASLTARRAVCLRAALQVCYGSRGRIEPLLSAAQIITEYKDSELDLVLAALERMTQHLTAAVVSNDIAFQQKARPCGSLTAEHF